MKETFTSKQNKSVQNKDRHWAGLYSDLPGDSWPAFQRCLQMSPVNYL